MLRFIKWLVIFVVLTVQRCIQKTFNEADFLPDITTPPEGTQGSCLTEIYRDIDSTRYHALMDQI